MDKSIIISIEKKILLKLSSHTRLYFLNNSTIAFQFFTPNFLRNSLYLLFLYLYYIIFLLSIHASFKMRNKRAELNNQSRFTTLFKSFIILLVIFVFTSYQKLYIHYFTWINRFYYIQVVFFKATSLTIYFAKIV